MDETILVTSVVENAHSGLFFSLFDLADLHVVCDVHSIFCTLCCFTIITRYGSTLYIGIAMVFICVYVYVALVHV